MDSAEHVLTTLLKQYRTAHDAISACRLLNDHPDNPSLLALSEVLNRCGITNGAFKLPFSQLQALPLPFIAYTNSNNGEYVIISAINDQEVMLTNRHFYETPMILSSFEIIYSGTVLVLDLDGVASHDTEPIASNDQQVQLSDKLPFAVTYLDIGASYGLPAKWDRFANDPHFNLILVEPDEAQATDIKMRYPAATVLQVGLGDCNECRDIHITASQSCSSVLEPNMEVLERFGLQKWFTVMDSIPVGLSRFDDVARKMQLQAPDFIKIDVQGFEYEVLNGFGEMLDQVLCIELETHLLELYKGQKLFFDLHKLLYSRGFYLRHLEQAGHFMAEAAEFNAYFVREGKHLGADAKARIQLWEQINQMPPPKPPRR